MKDQKKLISLALITLGIFILLVFLRGKEDNWVCKGGSWVKHGNPTATMPPTPCK